ncbi:ornithine cyclodeaminase [Lentzea aerocolonigenes]|uniref:Ornithine cyclodeaminase n=1 Tax=Lentzea aerocolonigenes TaxID=68170 RepID=A0A0F0H7K6_LENAE|nr:2,3-diaminopropionate biosynthesis protein SbnB [Lentzea aerocolonigenes]KJK51704.1 ornithine cyclodeaminase [Lentzea aerocolonigenes]
MFGFTVVPGRVVHSVIQSSPTRISDIVRECYLLHGKGDTVNPNSYFLRFPEKPDARIIALPAYVGGDVRVAGIKWIGSFPANIARNVPRASAVVVLNDYDTGYPFALLEAAQISSARTAASAVLGAEALVGSRKAGTVGFVGAGVIARNILNFFVAHGWDIGEILVHDQVGDYAGALAARAHEMTGVPSSSASLGEVLAASDVVVLATTAASPYIVDGSALRPEQTVLNISLRDLGPDVILNAQNVVDDVDHCLTAGTSPHLAEQQTGDRAFISGTLADVLTGELVLDDRRPRIFSPFGLGVLDLAVGVHVYTAAVESGQVAATPDFFEETERW